MNDLTIKQEFDNVKKELGHGVNISIINLVDQLIEKAHELRASDIHIDPLEVRVRIRFRIDGVLHDIYSFPKEINHEVISRIKILTKLRTDEHQATQDGRFRYIFSSDKKFIDFRVSIIPTYHGENAVLRLLTDKNGEHSLETLGFSERDRKKIENAIKKTNGMILSTGPTGSGKTTTMYTLIKMLNSPGVSIITIEDPIEYADNEIAHIAVNTALTGHILLSTLHTSDAATTLPRLLDMGIPEYLVASTVSIAIGQRLVRKICKDCKEKIKVKNNFTYKGKGCEACHGSGYFGRICINEVLVADNKIREAILRRASVDEIKKIAIGNGMTTMMEDGLGKVRDGVTTIEEVLRVIHE